MERGFGHVKAKVVSNMNSLSKYLLRTDPVGGSGTGARPWTSPFSCLSLLLPLADGDSETYLTR